MVSPSCEDLLYSIRCQNCTGRPVYVGPLWRDGNGKTVDVSCEHCGDPVDRGTLAEYAEVAADVAEVLEADSVPMDAPVECIKCVQIMPL